LGALNLICVVCSHEVRGFFYQHRLHVAKPTYPFCSWDCLEVGVRLASETGVIDIERLTGMEKQAIRDARHAFAAALEELGLMTHFENLDGAAIDRLIGAAVEGFRASMQRQTACGEVPL
jgi:hypothetical protein